MTLNPDARANWMANWPHDAAEGEQGRYLRMMALTTSAVHEDPFLLLECKITWFRELKPALVVKRLGDRVGSIAASADVHFRRRRAMDRPNAYSRSLFEGHALRDRPHEVRSALRILCERTVFGIVAAMHECRDALANLACCNILADLLYHSGQVAAEDCSCGWGELEG